jgi:adenylosuccinate synthase
MTVTAVIGSQWGDEGKGKAVDFLAEQRGLCGALQRREQRRAYGHQ